MPRVIQLTRITLLTILFLAACTVQIDQPVQSGPTRSPSTEDIAPSTSPGQDALSPTPAADAELSGDPSEDLSSVTLPGRLILTHAEDGIIELELGTGAIRSLFVPEPGGLLTAAAISPDGALAAIAYSPPAPEGEVQLGFSSLYIMPADGSASAELFLAGSNEEGYFTPAWLATGGYLYYGHFLRSNVSDNSSGFTLERVMYPETSRESLLEDALWPDFSSDGARMTFIRFNRETFADELFVANIDGSESLQLLESGSFQAVDSPRFSPDGTQVLFSAVPLEEDTSGSLWNQLFGPKIAKAHAVPSDMWIVSSEGGQPVQLTDLFVIGITGDYSPDGEYIAYVTVDGLFVMKSDGSGSTQLMSSPSLSAIQWIP